MERESVAASVKVVGVEIPFGDLMVLLFKVGLASIPVMLVLGFLWFLLVALFFRGGR